LTNQLAWVKLRLLCSWRGSSTVEQGTHKPLDVSSNLTLATHLINSLPVRTTSLSIFNTARFTRVQRPHGSYSGGCREYNEQTYALPVRVHRAKTDPSQCLLPSPGWAELQRSPPGDTASIASRCLRSRHWHEGQRA
jgi:hypothetical protein